LWLPKYVAGAFGGKTLWHLILGKYQHGTQPPPGDQYSIEFGSFKGTPYGQKAKHVAAFDDNIRVEILLQIHRNQFTK
jgi:hypothetical protein